MIDKLTELFEIRPHIGYLFAILPTSAGLLNILQHVQVLLGIVSLIVGIAVGSITFMIQYRAWKKGTRQKTDQSTDDSGSTG